MPTILKCIKFSFFGSKPFVFFSRTKTIYENFVKSCSLPFYKPESAETKQLIHTLKLCQVHFVTKEYALTNQEYLQDIAVLELAIYAIQFWLKRRGKISQRTMAVQRLYHSLKDQQNYMLNMQCHLSITPTNFAWHNPRYNFDTGKYEPTKLKIYLTPEQNVLIDYFYHELNPCAPENSAPKNKWQQFCCAAIAAPINFLSDFDCLEYLFDAFDVFLEFSHII